MVTVYVVMAYIVTVHVVMAYTVTVHVAMAYGYGIHSCGLNRYRQYSYGSGPKCKSQHELGTVDAEPLLTML